MRGARIRPEVDSTSFGRETWIHHSEPVPGPGPLLSCELLTGEQLESWVKRLKNLHTAAPHRTPRSLMRRLLGGVQLEQVLTLYEAEE